MKIYKMILTVLISSVLLLSACGDLAEETSTNLKSTEAASATDDIIVTSEQYSSSGMKIGKISLKSFSERIQVTGMMDVPPEYKAAVSVYFGGTVKKLHLLIGQDVKKGEVLFTLENPDYIQMQQDYLNAKNKLSYLKAEYERQKKLFAENVSSKKKYAKAESDYITIRSDFEALGKKLQLLNINSNDLDYESITTSAVIKAPIGGSITEVNISRGKYLSSNEVAVAIVRVKHMHIELNVFEKDINKIQKGQTIKFTLPDNKADIFEAEVFLVGKAVHSEDRTINIHGHLKDETQESRFIPGMYIEAEILVDELMRPAIPSDAVVNVDEDYFVLIKKSSNNNQYTFVQRQIAVGKTNDGYTEILNANEFIDDEIVTEGAFNLIQ